MRFTYENRETALFQFWSTCADVSAAPGDAVCAAFFPSILAVVSPDFSRFLVSRVFGHNACTHWGRACDNRNRWQDRRRCNPKEIPMQHHRGGCNSGRTEHCSFFEACFVLRLFLSLRTAIYAIHGRRVWRRRRVCVEWNHCRFCANNCICSNLHPTLESNRYVVGVISPLRSLTFTNRKRQS